MRQITISGNLGKDPQINTTQNGMKVANFSVVVRKSRPDDGGNYGTDWFRCSVWGKRATTIERFFHKGSHVTVTGTFELGEYDGNPQLNVNVTDFDLPDNKTQASDNPFDNGDDSIDISDNDLPF